MKEIGKGYLKASLLNSLHSLRDLKVDFLSQETIDSLNKGWDEDNPAKVYIAPGRSSELLEGRHRSTYFVLIGKPDYMVPVVFYTDD